MKPGRLTRLAVVAGLYAALTVLPPFSSISYGPVQVRVSEALTVLPFLSVDYAWGLYVGCIVANLGSPFLAYDLTLGALATLVAGFLTSRARRPALAPLPPVVINALVVAYYVSRLSGLPYAPTALYIALGEIVACYALGYPLLAYIIRNQRLREFLS
ncbi:MAG: QueT transporter family protein [Bacillota bacterium]|jgi:uncharacterized membrane protein|nr:QueT transporter family protein [Bacillota bacterium]